MASVPATGTAANAVKQSGGGIVIPPEDPEILAGAILDLYDHRQKAEALGRAGRKFALEHYAFEEALNRYEAMFAATCASWASPAGEIAK